MKTVSLNSRFWGVDAAHTIWQNAASSLLFVSTAGREAGSLESASAFVGEESAEWPYGPRPGLESPTLGANHPIPKKRHPAFAERRTGDAITGGVTTIKWLILSRKATREEIVVGDDVRSLTSSKRHKLETPYNFLEDS
jgi:hypothetical protein